MITGIILAATIILFILWRFVFFFRNPERVIPYNDDHILSPADGAIIYIKKVRNDSTEPIFSIKKRNVIKLNELMHIDDEALANKSGHLVGVFMNPFNVHYNRAPVQGHIKKIAHDFPDSPQSKKENLGMFNPISNIFFNEKPYWRDCDYLIDNERASFVIKNKSLTMYVTQIADKLVKKIVTYKQDENVQQGEVFGLIRMGSQVDIFVPDENDEFEVSVEEGDKVKAGRSVLLARKIKADIKF
ncbi:MAG: phosphatidylserine decarboxylase [bacterium]|nr:phosphatidylserine decarboxylase [bacterium]